MNGGSAIGGRRSESKQRFRTSDRLRKRQEFLVVQQQGRQVHLRDLLVLYRERAGGLRVGLTVSRKVGSAVRRNRVKRVLREVWRRHRHLLPEGYDVVIVAKRSAAHGDYGNLRRQLLDLTRKMRSGARVSEKRGSEA